MPDFHIAQSWGNDFDDIERRAAEGNGPRYSVPLLVRRLGAKLHQANRCALGRFFQRPVTVSADRHTSDLVVRP